MPLSLVIPTLNAAHTLGPALSALKPVAEIIVVDGGSSDGTAEIARAADARVVTAPPGRGGQIAAGIAQASQEWLLLLHADTRLGPGWRAAVSAHMAADAARAGYFRFVLDSPAAQARRLERAVAWRCRWLALPYGDQGMLIHRALLTAAGGVRPLPIMEDVDLVRRLGRRRLTGLEADAVTSPARWERDGWIRRSVRNLTCLSLWSLGVPPATIRRLYG